MDLSPSALPLAPASPAELAHLDACLAALGGDDSPARLAALLALAEAVPMHDAERLGSLAAEAEALAVGLGDDVAQARAVGLRGRSLFFLAHNAEAVVTLTDAIERFSALGMMAERLRARSMLAGVLASIGDYEEAISGALANLDEIREAGDAVAEGWVLVGLSGAYADLGDADRALDAAEGALALFTDMGVPMGVARAETGIGTALLLRDRPDAAEAHLTSALARFHDLDDPVGESRALNDLGTAARLRGDVEAGLVLHREALARRRGTANRQAQSTSLLHIGEALVALGRPEEAVEALAEALSLAEGIGARPREEQVHAVLVEAYGALGDPAQALGHARAHMAVREAILDAQTRGRLQTMQVRFETEQLREAQAAAALRNAALGEANERLVDALGELRAAQRQLVQTEKLASLGRVTAGIAHEIRNPLNFVVGFSGLALDLLAELRQTLDAHPIPDPAAAAEAGETLALLASNAARVDEHARRANDIVTGMLEHSRAVGGPRGRVRLSEILDAALAEAQDAAPDGLRIVREDAGAEAVEVEAAPGALRRAFTNLIGNAYLALAERAAAPPGGWTPTLTVALRRAGESSVEVAISDNGPGIAADARALVFEPFYTTRPTGQGTGLGLSLAYDIVTEGHAGRLDLRDTPGGGATFVVTLPEAA